MTKTTFVAIKRKSYKMQRLGYVVIKDSFVATKDEVLEHQAWVCREKTTFVATKRKSYKM